MEAIKIIEERFHVNLPTDLKEFWTRPYQQTFRLYKWQGTFSILNPNNVIEEAKELSREDDETSLLQQVYGAVNEEAYYKKQGEFESDPVVCTHTINNFYPKDDEMPLLVYTLVAFARDTEGDRNQVLAAAFDKEGKYLGLFLWNTGKSIEAPIFIADSVDDLVRDNVILINGLVQSPFDAKKYLDDIFRENLPGFILPLKRRAPSYKEGNDMFTSYQKLLDFYQLSFKEIYRGRFEFWQKDDFVFIYIEKGPRGKRLAFNEDEIDSEKSLIELINDELNTLDKFDFGRPGAFGYYLIDNRYVALLQPDVAARLIQKGYMKVVYRLLPMLAYYNPGSIPKTTGIYTMLGQLNASAGKKLTWVIEE